MHGTTLLSLLFYMKTSPTGNDSWHQSSPPHYIIPRIYEQKRCLVTSRLSIFFTFTSNLFLPQTWVKDVKGETMKILIILLFLSNYIHIIISYVIGPNPNYFKFIKNSVLIISFHCVVIQWRDNDWVMIIKLKIKFINWNCF